MRLQITLSIILGSLLSLVMGIGPNLPDCPLVSASLPVVGTAIRVSSGEFSTLLVTRMN